MATKKTKPASKKLKKARKLTIEDLRNVTGGMLQAMDMMDSGCKYETGDHSGKGETDRCS